MLKLWEIVFQGVCLDGFAFIRANTKEEAFDISKKEGLLVKNVEYKEGFNLWIKEIPDDQVVVGSWNGDY